MKTTEPNKDQAGAEPSFAACIGVDWADRCHAVALRAAGSEQIEESWLEADPGSVHVWARGLRERFGGAKIAVAVEMSRGALVEELLSHDFIELWPLNPATTCRYREAFAPSGAKDDQPDARLHLELLLDHREKLRPLPRRCGLDRRFGILLAARRKLIDLRTDIGNQLRAVLKDYHLLHLEVGGEIGTLLSSRLLARWPDLASLKRARPATLRAFYHANSSRRSELIEKRIAKIASAEAVSEEIDYLEPMSMHALALAKQLETLALQIAKMDKEIAALWKDHPDRALWESFPGAGAALAPRLAVAWGSERGMWEAARDMQLYSGVAPVTERSGNRSWVHRRYSRPMFLHQTFWEYAHHSALCCEWARAFLDGQKARGKKHSTAVRALAFKWIRIMHACWKSGEPYDDERYTRELAKKNSPLAAALAKAA